MGCWNFWITRSHNNLLNRYIAPTFWWHKVQLSWLSSLNAISPDPTADGWGKNRLEHGAPAPAMVISRFDRGFHLVVEITQQLSGELVHILRAGVWQDRASEIFLALDG